MDIARKIRHLRKHRGLSQSDIAKHLDVSQGLIGFWERGVNRPSITHVNQLAELFMVPVDHLMNDADDRTVAELHDEIEVRRLAASVGWTAIYLKILGFAGLANGVAKQIEPVTHIIPGNGNGKRQEKIEAPKPKRRGTA